MLVSIAMAALTIAGVRGNMGKGLKVADAIQIQPPGLGMTPAMATAGGGIQGGGVVFTPGSIATTGPVDIGISAMTGIGAGGGKAGSAFRSSKEAFDAAKKLGFDRRIAPQKAPFHSHGQSVFYNGKRYITPDVDGHKGGVWKVFDRHGRRLGTYDEALNRIGD